MAHNDGFITVKIDDGKVTTAVIKASAITAVVAANKPKPYYTTLIHLQGTYLGCNEPVEDVVKQWQEAFNQSVKQTNRDIRDTDFV